MKCVAVLSLLLLPWKTVWSYGDPHSSHREMRIRDPVCRDSSCAKLGPSPRLKHYDDSQSRARSLQRISHQSEKGTTRFLRITKPVEMALAVRVSSPNGSGGTVEPSISHAGVLSVFAETSNQFYACSGGQTQLQLASHAAAADGVLELLLDVTLESLGSDFYAALDYLYSQVCTALGAASPCSALGQGFDHFFFVLPYSTSAWMPSGAVAVAISNYDSALFFQASSGMSFFEKSTILHELGHLLDLAHAQDPLVLDGDFNELVEYGDDTTVMGNTFGNLCFGGPSMYEFGWFPDKTLVLGLGDDPVTVDIAGVADNFETTGQYILVKIGPYFVTFNRVKDITGQVPEHVDRVLVHLQQENVYGWVGSVLLAALDTDETYSSEDGVVSVRVASKVMDALSYATVEINPGGLLANDECTGATWMNVGDVVSGLTSGAFSETNVPAECGTSITAPGVWYVVLGNGDAFTASTCDYATFDTKLSVFRGSCAALTCVAGNDDNCLYYRSSLTWTTEPDVPYFILVHGYDAETGAFHLELTSIPRPDNDLCSDAVPLAVNDILPGSNDGATSDDECIYDGSSNGVWYSAVGTGAAFIADTCAYSNFLSEISVFTGGCGDLQCVAPVGYGYCSYGAFLEWITTPDSVYHILVHGYNRDSGDFDISLSAVQQVENDLCSSAILLNMDAIISASLNGATDDSECIYGGEAPGIWYEVVGTGARFTLDSCSFSNFYMEISVFTGDCNQLTCVVPSVYGYCGGSDSEGAYFEWDTVPGERYRVLVHGWGGQKGDFTLQLTSFLGPENDECSNAFMLTDSVTVGTSVQAIRDTSAPATCGPSITGPGVWYTMLGDGRSFTASTCSFANFNTKLTVFEGSFCGDLTCVDGNDNACGFQSSVTWTTTLGAKYYILVHGARSETGDFELTLDPAPPSKESLLSLYRVIPTNDASAQYQGSICSSSVTGFVPCDSTVCDVSGYDRWALRLKANVDYAIQVSRQECALDPIMMLSEGVLTGTQSVCIGNRANPGFLAFSDDGTEKTLACRRFPDSPFADPYIEYRPREDGLYTISVASFLSDGCSNEDRAFEYEITVNPPPEECDDDLGGDGGGGGGGDDVDTGDTSPGYPTSSPSITPSGIPSAVPSSAPSESVAPSGIPSETPSMAPTICNDERSTFFPVISTRFMKTCGWLSPRIDALIVGTSEFSDLTEDELAEFGFETFEQFGNTSWRDFLCSQDGAAYHICPETCGQCDDDCEDRPSNMDPENNFLDRQGNPRHCAWLRANPRNIDRYCGSAPNRNGPAARICPETCQVCSA